MSTEVATLAHFFGPPDPSALRNIATKTRGPRVPAELQDAAADRLLEATRSLLDNPIIDIFADAWTTRRDFQRYREAPPEKVNEHALVSHDIGVTRTPRIELMLNGAPTGVIFALDLKLAFSLAGAKLHIQNNRIIGAHVGEFAGKGTISFAEVTLYERKSAAFRLPGGLTLSKPLAFG